MLVYYKLGVGGGGKGEVEQPRLPGVLKPHETETVSRAYGTVWKSKILELS